ncbi:hypothetical protein NDU88_001398, partial [Pleurodeles waltl]
FDQERVEESACLSDYIIEDVSSPSRALGIVHSSDFSRPFTLQGPSEIEDSPSSEGSSVLRVGSPARRSQDRDVMWLSHMDAWNGRAIFPSSPDVVIESDASRW